MIQKIFSLEDKRQVIVSLKMKYYFASLEAAWSKINYDNGIMWEASQHIQLQPSLGNKTNTETAPPGELVNTVLSSIIVQSS